LYPFEDLIPAYQRPKAMWNGVLAGGCVMVLTMLVEVCGLTRWIGLAHDIAIATFQEVCAKWSQRRGLVGPVSGMAFCLTQSLRLSYQTIRL
jgi:hypothetical protein